MPWSERGVRTARAAPLVLALVLSVACGAAGQVDEAADTTPRSPASKTSPAEKASPRASSRPSQRSLRPSPSSVKPSHARPLSWGPTQSEWRQASRIVGAMSPTEKAGQVIVAGFEGTQAPVSLVRRQHVGGVIVMGYNVRSAAQVRSVNRALRAEAQRQGRTWPLVTSVDQEGGLIARVEQPLTEFPTYMTFGAAGDARLARSVARASGRELRALGFTMVFAPDADVTSGPDDPTIGSRSAGSDPKTVARMVRGSLQGYADADIVAVPKHFPGHGSVPADSHVSLPVQHETLEQLTGRDLVPFRSAVDAGAGAVMVAHIDVRAIDPGTPSSVSSKLVDGILRKRLGFQGAVVTDALEMAGVAEKYGSADAGVRALLAGADVLLLPADAADLHAAILRALRSGRLPQARLDEAATRSVALMLQQQANAGAEPSTSQLGKAGPTSYAASLRGLTVVSGPCKGRLVGRRVSVVGGEQADRERFAAAAERAGLDVGDGGAVVRLLSKGSGGGPGDVVVALDTPYALADSRARTARIALYGRTPDAFRALADVVAGKARGRGHLPVRVNGVRPGAGCR